MRYVLRAVVALALAYSVTLWLLHSAPWWRALPDVAIPVSHPECGSANAYRRAYESQPDLHGKVLPLVMAEKGDRGRETSTSAWSCDLMAEAMRAEHPSLAAVPQRFLCSSVRRRARDLYEEAHLTIGPPLWIVDGEAVGSAGIFEALTARGLKITRDGLRPAQ